MKLLHHLIGSVLLLYGGPAFAEVIGIGPDQVAEMVKNRNALVIDVRTPREWNETGTIPSSRTLMFFDENGEYDSQKWLAELRRIKKPDQAVILVCRSGKRSSKVGDFLDRDVGLKNIYHLENGITEWIRQGKATEPCTSRSC